MGAACDDVFDGADRFRSEGAVGGGGNDAGHAGDGHRGDVLAEKPDQGTE